MTVNPTKLKSLKRLGGALPPTNAHPDIALAEQAGPTVEGILTPAPAPLPTSRLDGRTLRRTGRTLQFATKFSPAFDQQIQDIAMSRSMLIVQVLEASLAAYSCIAEVADAAGETPEQTLGRLLAPKSGKRQ